MSDSEETIVYIKGGEKILADSVLDPAETRTYALVWLFDERHRRIAFTQASTSFVTPTTPEAWIAWRDEKIAISERKGYAPYLSFYETTVPQLNPSTEPWQWWMDYDGNAQTSQVNQLPDLDVWERHVCSMAHDTDQFNIDAVEFRKPSSYKDVPQGAHSAETQIRNQNTLQFFRAVIGNAFRKLDAWAKLDPRGDTGSFSTDWKQQREGIRAIIEDKLCQACEHQWSAREFARLHDYSAWRTILDHRRVLDEGTGSVFMRVPAIVRDAVPWTPHPTENLTFFGGNNVEVGWETAVSWYDEAIHRYDRLYAPRYATA